MFITENNSYVELGKAFITEGNKYVEFGKAFVTEDGVFKQLWSSSLSMLICSTSTSSRATADTPLIKRSDDLVSYTDYPYNNSIFPIRNLLGMFVANGRIFIFMDGYYNYCYYTTDMLNYTKVVLPISQGWFSCIWDGFRYVFSGPKGIYYSYDLVNFTLSINGNRSLTTDGESESANFSYRGTQIIPFGNGIILMCLYLSSDSTTMNYNFITKDITRAENNDITGNDTSYRYFFNGITNARSTYYQWAYPKDETTAFVGWNTRVYTVNIATGAITQKNNATAQSITNGVYNGNTLLMGGNSKYVFYSLNDGVTYTAVTVPNRFTVYYDGEKFLGIVAVDNSTQDTTITVYASDDGITWVQKSSFNHVGFRCYPYNMLNAVTFAEF